MGGWATPRPAARCGKSVHYASQIRCSLGPVIYGHTMQLKIGALCSSDSVQSVACDIWTHYATQNRCTVLLIFGVVCGLDGPTVQLKISALCHNRHVFCAVSFAKSIGDVLTTQSLCNLWSRHREFREKKKTLPRPGSKPSSSSMESNPICMISVAP